ncbi:MAG: hypothetical protein P8Q41_12060 [Saprospiraceae bacterium]|nr:hypothetical protein [Saprospiraceae bacterium]
MSQRFLTITQPSLIPLPTSMRVRGCGLKWRQLRHPLPLPFLLRACDNPCIFLLVENLRQLLYQHHILAKG